LKARKNPSIDDIMGRLRGLRRALILRGWLLQKLIAEG
jgi:hypothetical protein